MSENDSQRPQDPGNAGETQQQPRVQVESTPADSNIPYVQAYDMLWKMFQTQKLWQQ